MIKTVFKRMIILLFVVALLGLLLPEEMVIPVEGATSNDWNHETFWHEPWGSSVVHKGIDIFGKKFTPVVASTHGIVIFSGRLSKGGNAVAVLGPRWRVHYFAHLNDRLVELGDVVSIHQKIGTLGDTGNAKGKQPHVHYSIFSLLPMPWLMTTETQGWKKMFYLNPHEKLLSRKGLSQ